jgi:predicted enzyme related to lactoylglutathione lyase
MHFMVNIDVDDLEKAIRFYTAAFDLKPGRRLGETIVEMTGGPAPIYLLQKSSGSTPAVDTKDVRNYQRHWTPLHLDFVVGDIEAATQRALTAGALQEQAITTHAWGKLALMADPFGHGFCFVQFIGKGYDKIAACCGD